MKWLENMTGGYSASAKVVNDTLVLSLPDAKSPVVWRMELGEIKAAAFEISQQGEDFILTMKIPKGEKQDIAPFDNKNSAMKALMAASQAMEHAQNVTPANDSIGVSGTIPAKKAKGGQLVAGIVGIFILGILIFSLTRIGPQTSSAYLRNVDGASAGTSHQGGSAATGNAPGVPVSADDFLRGR